LHTLWEGSIGWITTNPTSLKRHHLARHPYMSLGYVHDPAKPVYVDCVAEWIDDRPTKEHAWNLFLSTPPPLGFDPTPLYGSIDEPNPGGPPFGLLKLTPYRILLYQFPTPSTIWTPE
jgi:hypothetical protein